MMKKRTVFNRLIFCSEFSNLACALLDKWYREDMELASQLLTYDLVNWSHWTCLTLAVSANLKDFLSHPACQFIISELWMGGMRVRKYVAFKIIFALIFPPAIFWIHFKSAKEIKYMPKTQEEHEQNQENQSRYNSFSSGQDRQNSIASFATQTVDLFGSNPNLVSFLALKAF